jgi:hypothetical protein
MLLRGGFGLEAFFHEQKMREKISPFVRLPSRRSRSSFSNNDDETGTTAISQNFFVRRFETALFSQTADK